MGEIISAGRAFWQFSLPFADAAGVKKVDDQHGIKRVEEVVAGDIEKERRSRAAGKVG